MDQSRSDARYPSRRPRSRTCSGRRGPSRVRSRLNDSARLPRNVAGLIRSGRATSPQGSRRHARGRGGCMTSEPARGIRSCVGATDGRPATRTHRLREGEPARDREPANRSASDTPVATMLGGTSRRRTLTGSVSLVRPTDVVFRRRSGTSGGGPAPRRPIPVLGGTEHVSSRATPSRPERASAIRSMRRVGGSALIDKCGGPTLALPIVAIPANPIPALITAFSRSPSTVPSTPDPLPR